MVEASEAVDLQNLDDVSDMTSRYKASLRLNSACSSINDYLVHSDCIRHWGTAVDFGCH